MISDAAYKNVVDEYTKYFECGIEKNISKAWAEEKKYVNLIGEKRSNFTGVIQYFFYSNGNASCCSACFLCSNFNLT